MKPEIKALTFDVFGTVVDWRSSIIEEGNQLNSEWGWELNWEDFADRWRGMYQPSMEKVRSCLLYTSPSPRDRQKSRMPSSA